MIHFYKAQCEHGRYACAEHHVKGKTEDGDKRECEAWDALLDALAVTPEHRQQAHEALVDCIHERISTVSRHLSEDVAEAASKASQRGMPLGCLPGYTVAELIEVLQKMPKTAVVFLREKGPINLVTVASVFYDSTCDYTLDGKTHDGVVLEVGVAEDDNRDVAMRVQSRG